MAEVTIELTFKFVQTIDVGEVDEAEACNQAMIAGKSLKVDYPDGSGSIEPVEVRVIEVCEATAAPSFVVIPKAHIKVEFDRSYSGGDYSGVGEFAYVPENLWQGRGQLASEVEIAQYLDIAPYNIINISVDERFDNEGNPLEDLDDEDDDAQEELDEEEEALGGD